ncbi:MULTISPECIES: hypothetical protein [unclassified Ensifer]|uniref:hypothetical protein n=1 Tax=unclassified Ensifer TaxID=2633371 RepID=UPI000813626F|nr:MULTISPECIES: hypothetical protein [unclassified Ensifer]OCP00855.1 hypothetical protein BC374_28675 [Ensifer sp. LC13]OCP01670.1 hypothetical protein BBX50_28670 [Ensifer sp. LC11]OCP07291.1 hypothetical protein BC362_11165 [Ensifer sp. LC14]OCP29725.1 hypothetical protein BC364_28690 [Ensifer sp. LC499]
MANVWLDATAPYVLVAAVGATGWVVNTSVDDLKQANIIEFEIKNVTAEGQHFKSIDIYNRSLAHNLASGKFSFRCAGVTTADCFAAPDVGSVITFIPLSGVSYNSNIESDGPIFKADARLAPQSAVRYEIRVKSAQDEIMLLYEPEGDLGSQNPGIIFRRGESWEGWLIANYLGYLTRTFFGLICLLALWFAGAFVAIGLQWYGRRTAVPPPNEPKTLRVIIEQRGSTDD